MKLRYKLFLILILFLGIMIFHNLDCYGFYESKENIPSNTPYYDTFYNYLPERGNFFIYTLFDNKYLEVVFSNYEDHVFNIHFNPNNNSFNVFTSSITDFNTFKAHSGVSFKINTNGSLSIFNKLGYNYSFSVNASDKYPNPINVLYSTDNIYIDANLFYEKNSENIDKINLFKLNLTDKNLNNTKHTFTLGIDKNNRYYEELTNLINSNHNYCIYLTDYTRLLTYENNHLDCPLKAGSYLLSGYIDFLVSENAYFYYSPHYNRIKVCAGNYFNDVVTDRGKRFFFTLVFSDDSDSTYFTIQEDNGSLWALSDTTGGWNDGNSTSDKLEDITNSYFIGSNQTIYYANEDNNHILDSLTNSIYYVGCSNSAYYRKYSASNPIKTRGNDDYIYNFDFSGGKIKYFFLSEYNSGSNISNENKDIADKKEKNTVITDTSNGNSNIIPTDHTTYTYIYNYITNESNPEEDEKHVETERNPYISDDKNEDTSNWSILDFLRGIYNTLTGKEDDSSPSTTSINQTTNIIKDKFSFKDNMINNANEIKNFIANTQETHKYYLNINHKYLQGNICIIDLSWYAPYKETVDAFICAFAYLAFIWHMFCRIPNLINGASATTYVSDISQYLNKK